MAAASGADRARVRRVARGRPRQQPSEVGLPAQRAQRLHLRRPRRGARADRRARGPDAVRHAALRRHPDRGERTGHVRPAPGRGITGWIGLQTIVNLGAVTGLLPITGVPLPFLSFGGTALVVTLAGVGVLASVAPRGRAIRGEEARPRSALATAARGVGGEDRDRRRRHGRPHLPVARGGRPPARRRSDRRFVGSPAGQEASIVPAAGYRFHPVAAAPFRRELSLRSAAAPFVALRSVVTCRPIVRDADAVLGWADTRASPPVLAARSRRGSRSSCTSRTRSRASRTDSSRGSRRRWRSRSRTRAAGSPVRPDRGDWAPAPTRDPRGG